ncbi:MAG: FHA domain-containing protein [Isosphaeraceae bacterium]
MRDPGEPNPGTLWTDGDMMFRVAGKGAGPDRLVKVRKPFALVGRAPDTDVVVEDRAASARHAYLHLDPRGVYAVDLVTRTGTRIKGTDRPVGWIRPGDRIEVAGHRIELLRIRIGGHVVEPAPCSANLLADSDRPNLPGVTLEPMRAGESPWVLGSELVFLGWSASCGIQVKDAAVSRTHCALVRSSRGAFLVDLCGRQTWVEDQPVRGAAALHDGDLITLGATQFTARVTPPRTESSGPLLPEVIPRHEATAFLSPFGPPSDAFGGLDPVAGLGLPPISSDLAPEEARGALLAWVADAVRGGQGEVLRRQGEFHRAMAQALLQMQRDNAALLTAQLERIESIDRELATIRAEIERRNGRKPPPPDVEPLKIPRNVRPPEEADPATPESRASTAWLLDRVNQLETENKSAWKDLVSRLSPQRKQG